MNFCIIWFISSTFYMPRNTQNVVKRAQFCSRCVATSLRLQLDVCKVALSPGALQWLRCSARAGTGLSQTCTPKSLCLLVNRPISSLCPHQHAVLPHAFSFSDVPHVSRHCNADDPLQCPSVPLNLLDTTSCGCWGSARVPAGQLTCTWGQVGWPLSD